jgi:hypothetical protein
MYLPIYVQREAIKCISCMYVFQRIPLPSSVLMKWYKMSTFYIFSRHSTFSHVILHFLMSCMCSIKCSLAWNLGGQNGTICRLLGNRFLLALFWKFSEVAQKSFTYLFWQKTGFSSTLWAIFVHSSCHLAWQTHWWVLLEIRFQLIRKTG